MSVDKTILILGVTAVISLTTFTSIAVLVGEKSSRQVALYEHELAMKKQEILNNCVMGRMSNGN